MTDTAAIASSDASPAVLCGDDADAFAGRATLSEAERLALIAATIEEIRPIIRADGGDLELIAVRGERVEVRLTGTCLSCSLAGQTLGGIRRRLMAVLDIPVMVVPIIG
ncbi:NifU family protein [Xanthobacter agilis]|jgi:Fe-S cluster biogenesis protein NfuA|uniref:Fe-S cluster biogenesis protein NfuA n=1 Tax=Xanthobacter agilis TaxID=47492 RepID=A0ABU0LDD8_XANAG|nr:NifU family protein [Xanthobacter agilis]MDQ0505124.1 Fe-S cluster biogenesis protein NfuA [Xanthobacter agilis]